MTGNRSLDEFVAGEPEAEAPEPSRTEASAGEGEREGKGVGEPEGEQPADPEAVDHDEGDDESTPVEPASVEPMAPTYARSTAGGACAACGATVEVRWRDDAGLVCPDCKAW